MYVKEGFNLLCLFLLVNIHNVKKTTTDKACLDRLSWLVGDVGCSDSEADLLAG